MRILIAVLSFCALVVSCNGARGKSGGKQVSRVLPQQTPKQDEDATKEAAIKAAVAALEKTYGRTDQFVIVPCNQTAFWRIIFEPKIDNPSNAAPEYVVDKRTGSIISKRELSLHAEMNSQQSANAEISRETAIGIARKDAITAYGSLTKLDLTVCEFTNAWRIIYSPKIGLNGGGPEYVIDKWSGKIMDKKYYQ